MIEFTRVSPGYNLLRLRAVRLVALSPLFPYVIQAAILAVFLWLAVIGWGQFAPEGVPAKQFAQTNLVTLVIWGLWWPAMVWVAVIVGRVWCAVCPLELLSNFAERLGRRLGVKQQVLGRWLRSGFLIVGFYALIQMLIAGVELHRVPGYTSVFLWSLLALAAFTGFFLKDRAFCRGFCPVGLLLSTYGRGAVLAVRSCGDGPCGGCTEKNCRRSEKRNRLDARSCPSLLNPVTLNSNADCLMCLQCAKACPSSNMGLFLRRPFHIGDVREAIASWPVMLFLIVLSGYVGYELCSEWKAAQGVFLWVPEKAAALFGLTSTVGWVKGAWTVVLVPLLFWTVLSMPVLLLGGAKTMSEAWRRLALPMTFILAAGHLAKGLAKSAQWAGYSVLAWQDPTGISAAQAIVA
ncbi:MAG: 4Fe-4S binding protein, partial [Planctomycetes bacterium]|nr:4Fe-4S binding protein [Planctomycetota bacterium]